MSPRPRLASRFVTDGGRDDATQQALQQLTVEAAADGAVVGRERLASLLEYATAVVPAYLRFRGRALAEFPVIGKRDLRNWAQFEAPSARSRRRNRTSGSTNTPTVTLLGWYHETNQVVRWLRHWAHFQVPDQSRVLHVVPRSYRLRAFNGAGFTDLAGEHCIEQLHYRELSQVQTVGRPEVIVANPHMLNLLSGKVSEGTPPVLVTSYEQRPVRWPDWSARSGDVYGLSEIGDVAYQRSGERAWHVHEDLVLLEIPAPLTTSERDGRVVVTGELVVTDLTNWDMPLIRYATGDIGVLEAGAHTDRLTDVVGRRIAADGTCLAGFDVCSLLPLLSDTGGSFAASASQNELMIWLESPEGLDRSALRARLPQSADLILADTRQELERLTPVFVSPTPGAES